MTTSNGGLNWSTQIIDSTVQFYSIDLLDEISGYIVGYKYVVQQGYFGYIYKTTDGGQSWTEITNGSFPALLDVYFINTELGYAVGTEGEILKTTDGGQSWISQNSGTDRDLFSISFWDENIGYAAGQMSTILKTLDGGQNWLNISGSYSISFPDIDCIDENNVVITGWNGKLIRTTDGGENWIQQVTKTTTNLNGVCFIDNSIGYVAGAGGTILKTTNGGFITDVKEIPSGNPEQPNSFLLYQNYPNPFNPSTTIRYEIPERSFVRTIVYDILGKKVETLVNEEKSAGSYEVEFDGSRLTSGIYFYQLQAQDLIQTKKMILLK
jgi:photosystem II stability/assembly factor-like uncharacterized protein